MSSYDTHLPDVLPMLSRGAHRNPRKGACFMELVSVLAGERWSDHPACTHPLLAAVARLVNDLTSDAARPRLAGATPAVIGLTSDDPRVDARIALRCATIALPFVSDERQRVLAVSVLACERVLADLDGRPAGRLEERSRWALAQVPDAALWAHKFTRQIHTSPRAFRRFAAPSIVRYAVEGVAQACVLEPDEMLRELLLGAIDECAALVHRDTGTGTTYHPAKWATACRLTGATVGR